MMYVINRGVLVENTKDKEKNSTQLHSQGFIFHNLIVQQKMKYN